jgi:carboxymethylenebutenolidase
MRVLIGIVLAAWSAGLMVGQEIVSFKSGNLELKGALYKPNGPGPFPALLYNHGSGRDPHEVSDALGPLFQHHGWIFFMPHRRGQGLSGSAGPYIRDQIAAAYKQGLHAAVATMVRSLETDHLDDQVAAFDWLRSQSCVQSNRIAVAGNSFGGIEAVLGAERGGYCAAVDSAGAAESWSRAHGLQAVMIRAVRDSRAPIFFFQAQNDYDLSPSLVLSSVMKDAGKPYQMKIYPAFGRSASDGHVFGYFGGSIWGDDVFQFLEAYCRDQPTTRKR